MKAEVIALGLPGPACETGQPAYAGLGESLTELGFELTFVTAVKAREAEAEETLRQAFERSHLIIITGGGGPGTEELAKKTLSRLLDKRLILQADLVQKIESAYRAKGLEPPATYEKSALLPYGAKSIEDQQGVPSGFYMEHAGRYVLYVPVLADDFSGSAPVELIRRIAGKRKPRHFERSRVLRCYGLAASRVRELLKDVLPVGVTTDLSGSLDGVDVKLKARSDSPERAEAILRDAVTEAMARLGDYFYGVGGEGMEHAVARLLFEKKLTIATAESCTGGLIAKRLTDISGSSGYMERGVVTYSNRSKVELLGVPAKVIEEHGAVSKEAAEAMAAGIRWNANSDLGLSVTGIAGPTGGTPEKPVGLVYIGLATPEGVTVKAFNFPGDRSEIRWATSQRALDIVRRYLLS